MESLKSKLLNYLPKDKLNCLGFLRPVLNRSRRGSLKNIDVSNIWVLFAKHA